MGRGEPPSTDTHVNALLLAQVLALAEGRDYLVPDDIKLVLLGRGDRFYGPSSKTVQFVLEQELRSIEYPRSIILGEWKYFLPKKQFLVGIPVPMV